MGLFTQVQTISGGALDNASTAADLVVRINGGTPELALVNLAQGVVTRFSLTAGAAATVFSEDPIVPGSEPMQSVMLNGTGISLATSDLAGLIATPGESAEIYAGQTGQATDLIEAISVASGTANYVYLTQYGQDGVSSYRVNDGGTLTFLERLPDTDSVYSKNVTDLATMQSGGESYVIAVSDSENGVTSYRVGVDGRLVSVSAIGPAEGLPISGPQAVETATLNGITYVLVAASGSSSISVLRVEPNGELTPLSQIMDDLSTRFANVSMMEVFQSGDQVFVLASGSDDGLSLFTLLPNGDLLHLETLVDQTTTSLAKITDIEVIEVNGELQVFAISATEAGVTQFTLNLDNPGPVLTATGATLTGTSANDILYGTDADNTLDGGQGDDTLIDGRGADSLRGGPGADIFVFTADGTPDTVLDFEIGVDRLDLSGFERLRSLDQVTFTSTETGVILTYNGEQIELITADGSSLDSVDFTFDDIVNVTRVTVGDPATNSDTASGTLFGSDGNDMMRGSALGDRIEGGDGDDTLFGDGGDDLIFGGRGDDTLWGEIGNDTLLGGEGDDLLNGGDWDDTLWGESGADQLRGGNGNDLIYGGEGIDLLIGGDGIDRLYGGTQADRLWGGNGADYLNGGVGDDTLNGGNGDDVLLGGSGNDKLNGGNWSDTLWGQDGNDRLEGGWGDDRLEGGGGNDLLLGGEGKDRLNGSSGADTLWGQNGADVLKGGSGADSLYGGNGDDILLGGTGNDKLYGGIWSDTLWGQDGDDYLNGERGNDKIYGGNGNDILIGWDGKDTLIGGEGDDKLWGGGGKDVLNGGAGNDVMNGGAAADIFVFSSFRNGEIDIISDFQDGSDMLQLDGISGGLDGLTISETVYNGETYVEIDYAGHAILIDGISLADFSADDIIFI